MTGTQSVCCDWVSLQIFWTNFLTWEQNFTGRWLFFFDSLFLWIHHTATPLIIFLTQPNSHQINQRHIIHISFISTDLLPIHPTSHYTNSYTTCHIYEFVYKYINWAEPWIMKFNQRKFAVLQNWQIIGRLPSSYPRVMHSSISVQLLKGNFLLLLMVQLISLISIPKESVHPYIASIQIFLVKTTGQNWRECCVRSDVSVDVNWQHSFLFPPIPLLNKVIHIKQLTISAAHML